MKKKVLVSILILAVWFFNVSFSYSNLTESDNLLADKLLYRYKDFPKNLKKEKSDHYLKLAEDSELVLNAYLWIYTWDSFSGNFISEKSVKNWINNYNKLDSDKKSERIDLLEEVITLSKELQRSFQIESEDNFQWYASTILPTPLYWLNKDDVDINFIMWWKWTTWLLLDSYNTIDQLDVILPEWTPVTLIDKVEKWEFTYYEVRTRDFDAWYDNKKGYYLDSRFVEKKENKPAELVHELPEKDEIFKALNAAIGSLYIRWWSYYQWIPEINDFYPTPNDVELSENEKRYKILQWTDCSGLLWQATNGYTPRNTRQLLTFWESVAISWDTVEQIVNKVQPLDLIVWAGHVIIILDNENAIESLRKENYEWGAEIVNLKERLEDIFTRRQPVDEWDKSELPDKEKFVIRRWYK